MDEKEKNKGALREMYGNYLDEFEKLRREMIRYNSLNVMAESSAGVELLTNLMKRVNGLKQS